MTSSSPSLLFLFGWFKSSKKKKDPSEEQQREQEQDDNTTKESTATRSSNNLHEVFESIVKLRPWDENERQRYNNDTVRHCLLTNPNLVKIKYDLKSQGRGSSTKRYPLFRIVSLGASLDVIQVMCATFPEAISEGGEFNSTPLHAACAYNSSIQVVEYLIQQYPQALQQRTKHGYTPLLNACEYYGPTQNNNDDSKSTATSFHSLIRLLVQHYPQAKAMKNKLGKTPYMTLLNRLEQQQQGQPKSAILQDTLDLLYHVEDTNNDNNNIAETSNK